MFHGILKEFIQLIMVLVKCLRFFNIFCYHRNIVLNFVMFAPFYWAAHVSFRVDVSKTLELTWLGNETETAYNS